MGSPRRRFFPLVFPIPFLWFFHLCLWFYSVSGFSVSGFSDSGFSVCLLISLVVFLHFRNIGGAFSLVFPIPFLWFFHLCLWFYSVSGFSDSGFSVCLLISLVFFVHFRNIGGDGRSMVLKAYKAALKAQLVAYLSEVINSWASWASWASW